MKKFLGKTLLLVGVIALGMFIGQTFAQFGASNTDASAMKLAWSSLDWKTFWAMNLVKGFINWVLWLLSLIALWMALFGWFKMVTAAGDDGKYKEWFKVLKQAAIWLIIVGLSWIIISSIFFFITKASATSGGWQTIVTQ